eukprot:CAMPEP_0196825800 /NCGR_PEP_ID=MMETSP1362-20130617/93269_1 /TAXON_ID=163516 /ORGANISM="Leptocylindrus danicus, Strain CCMP1856" /LENGTH=75 /DNA_ID=CAMNT_0042206291 /DNA_START=457 /DNA_END=684 /DNA_ORIENTATION=-
MTQYERIDEKLLSNKRDWDGQRYSWDSLPLAGEPLQKTWIIRGCLHAHASSLNGYMFVGHTTIAFFTVLPNNNTN